MSLTSLVVVLVVHVVTIATVEAEGDSPVAVDIDSPLPSAASLERVKPKAGSVQVPNTRRSMKPRQDPTDLRNATRTQPPRIAGFEESLQTAMLESDDHEASVTRNGSQDKTSGQCRDGAVPSAELLDRGQRINSSLAESLLELLALEHCADGSWAAGLQVESHFIAGLGIPVGSFRLADGSGMSRNNRFTARQLTRLLGYMFAHPLKREFLLSLPAPGSEHGRWDERLADPPFRANWRRQGRCGASRPCPATQERPRGGCMRSRSWRTRFRVRGMRGWSRIGSSGR